MSNGAYGIPMTDFKDILIMIWACLHTWAFSSGIGSFDFTDNVCSI